MVIVLPVIEQGRFLLILENALIFHRFRPHDLLCEPLKQSI